MVDLAEGPRMATNVVDCPFEQLEMARRVIFRQITDGDTIPPAFAPA